MSKQYKPGDLISFTDNIKAIKTPLDGSLRLNGYPDRMRYDYVDITKGTFVMFVGPTVPSEPPTDLADFVVMTDGTLCRPILSDAEVTSLNRN